MSPFTIYPGLTQALDPIFMQQVLQNCIAEQYPMIEIESCHIETVKYEPEKECLVLYRASLQDTTFARRWENYFEAHLLKSTESFPPLPSAFASNVLEPKSQISFFPHDPIMGWLPQICDEKHLLKRLHGWLFSKEIRPRRLQMKLLAYTPHMRATHQLDFELFNKVSGMIESCTWIGKTNAFKKPDRVFANYWALWKAGHKKISMPKPMGFLSNPPMTFQEKIEGARLGSVVDREDFGSLLVTLAEMLASFHGLVIPLNNVRKLEHEIRGINRWSGILIGLCPHLKSRIKSLTAKIAKEMERRFHPQCPIHADFHHTNVLVHGNSLSIIDMDEMTIGDPSLDVGRFLSSLRIPSLKVYGSFNGLESARSLFLETYLSRTPCRFENIKLFEAASLFTSAASSFRFQRKDWLLEVEMLIEEAEKIFMQANVKKQYSFAEPLKPNFPQRLEWAQDPVYLKAALSSHFLKTGVDVSCCVIKKVDTIKSVYKISVKFEGFVEKKKVTRSIKLLLADPPPTYLTNALGKIEALQAIILK